MSPAIVLCKEYYFISAVNDWNFHSNSGYKRYSISVTSAKILGLNFSSYLKWNFHIDSIIKKAKKRPYSLSQLKPLWPRYPWASSVFLHLHSPCHGQCESCLSRQSSRLSLQWTWGSTKAGYAHYFPFLLVQRVFSWNKPNWTFRPPLGTCRQTILGGRTEQRQ